MSEKQKKPQSKKPVVRQPNGRFQKGCSGNPGGETKIERKARQDIGALARRLIEGPDGSHKVFDRLIKIVEFGKPQEAVMAGKLLLEYAYGKATQPIEASGPDGLPIPISVQVIQLPDNGRDPE